MQDDKTLAGAIAKAGLGSPEIIHDGVIHRFTGEDDKQGSNNCWYVSYGTGGAFGSWKLGFTQKWFNGKVSVADKAAVDEQIVISKKKRAKELAVSHQRAMNVAQELYTSSSELINHQYSVKKKINAYGARQISSVLLIPIYVNDELVNIQRIYEDGSKWFLKGGRIKGCYFIIGSLSDRVIICEGYATGCSLYEHTGDPVVVAFNAGNLKSVALSIREKYPKIAIIIAADNDINTDGNPGRTKGREAALIVGGKCIYPDFTDEDFDGEGLTDFNDYLVMGGVL